MAPKLADREVFAQVLEGLHLIDSASAAVPSKPSKVETMQSVWHDLFTCL